jgi:DNA-binding transcriptional MocR family regulator
LPTVRALARERGVSPATVSAAFQRLRLRGLIAGAGRRGTRVTHRPALQAKASASAAKGLRNLADGNPDGRLLPRLPMLSREAARLYGEAAVDPALAKIARQQFASDGIDGELTVVSGGLDGIERVLQANLTVGDRVAVEDPGFTGVLDLLAALGLGVEPVAMDDLGLVPESLARALSQRVKALVLTPRAQNPTGAAFDPERAKALRSVLDRHPSVLVIEDDHAGPVAGTGSITLCPRPGHWAVVRSVSKSLGPDLRLAVVAADPTTVSRVEGRQRLGMGWVSCMLQRSVAALWSDARVAVQIAEASRTYAERRHALLDALGRRGIEARGRSGFNLWIPVPEEASAVAFLAERGWAVRAGEPYRLRSAPAIRVTASTLLPSEAERLAADITACLRPDGRRSTTR